MSKKKQLRQQIMTHTVIQHVLNRLHLLGVRDIFGVPGDYSFPITDAICADKRFRWIGNCNELNAAYAADGSARIKGIACTCSTYGVGELSALNGIAGAFAEHLTVIHLVGTPPMAVQQSHALVHHTLGNGEFDLFFSMTDPIVCAKTILTPDNCTVELEKIIDAALYHRRPVYIGIPKNYADMPVTDVPISLPPHASDPEALQAATEDILKTLTAAKTACVLPGIFLNRYGLHKLATDVITALGLPFATMMMDKSTLDETLPNYIGMYTGRLTNPKVRDFIENCDCILVLNAMFTDLNSGAFTSRIDPEKSIDIMHHHVRVGNRIYRDVEMKDVLEALIKHPSTRKEINYPREHGLMTPEESSDGKIVEEYLYPKLQDFFRPHDIIIAETGSCSMGLVHAHLPEGATFHNQTLWGAIGWATPAALGASLAAPERRTILITGEGSHQVTVQELGQFYRYGTTPVIFILNNNGFLIERELCKDPEVEYNEVASWDYAKLPAAMGCKGWHVAKVTTCKELDDVMRFIEESNCPAYIEIVTEKYESPLFLERLKMQMAK